jgi:hypothetical protein
VTLLVDPDLVEKGSFYWVNVCENKHKYLTVVPPDEEITEHHITVRPCPFCGTYKHEDGHGFGVARHDMKRKPR